MNTLLYIDVSGSFYTIFEDSTELCHIYLLI